jgi:hypothetical protein
MTTQALNVVGSYAGKKRIIPLVGAALQPYSGQRADKGRVVQSHFRPVDLFPAQELDSNKTVSVLDSIPARQMQLMQR